MVDFEKDINVFRSALERLESCRLFFEPNTRIQGQPSIARGEIDFRDEDMVLVVQRRAEALQDFGRVEFRLYDPGQLQNAELVLEGVDLRFKFGVVLSGFVKVVGDHVE